MLKVDIEELPSFYSSDSSTEELSCCSDSDDSAFFAFFLGVFSASDFRGLPRPRFTPVSLLAGFGLLVEPGLRPRFPLVAPLLAESLFLAGAADGSFRGRPRPRLTGAT